MEIGPLLKEWAESGYSDEKLDELKQRHPDVDWLVLAGKVMQVSADLEPRFERDIGSLWDKIERKVDGVEEPEEEEVVEETPVRPFRRKRSRIYGIVATLFLLAIVLIVVNSGGEDDLTKLVTGVAETDTVDFPDGTRVFLASGSTLRWDEENWSQKRHFDLEGEAFFDVAKGDRFTVGTGKGRIAVLGTEFNVRVRDRVLDVSCREGRVEVTYPNVKEQLGPGEFIQIGSDSKVTRGTISPSAVGTWTIGVFYYNGEALSRVFAEVHRQFDIEVDAIDQSIERIPCHGYFSNEDLEEAMKQLCIPLDLTYEIDKANKKVTVRR